MMPKKVEPLPCLCDERPWLEWHDIRSKDKSRVFCRNPRCACNPKTRWYVVSGRAVSIWNRWIREGLRRLAKVEEEQP
jgi:hypothetical protein